LTLPIADYGARSMQSYLESVLGRADVIAFDRGTSSA